MFVLFGNYLISYFCVWLLMERFRVTNSDDLFFYRYSFVPWTVCAGGTASCPERCMLEVQLRALNGVCWRYSAVP